jgi:hypothetical protein
LCLFPVKKTQKPRLLGSLRSLQGKKSPCRRFFGVLSAKRNKLLVFLACLAVLSCATPPYSTGAARQIPEDFFGMTPYQRSDMTAEDFELLDELGVVWQRRTCRWSSLEPRPGEWDFSSWDSYVDDSKAAGKKLIAILAYDTPWIYNRKTAGDDIGPEELPHYLNYVETVTARYKGRIDAYEIWNEPNMLNYFWKGSDDDFFTMTIAAAQVIRRTDPHAKILAGSLWRVPGGFIRRLFKSGVMDHADALSFHPYAVNPRGAVKLYDKLAGILEEFNYSGEVWITEVGYPTGGWYPTVVWEENFPRDIVKTLAGLAVRNVRVLVWYEFKDSYNRGEAPSRWNSESFFGLSYLDHTRKNGFEAWGLCGRYLAGSEYRPDLPERQGLPDRIVSLCFRNAGGQNTLILWNESGGTLKARIVLPGTDQTLHDLSTGQGRRLAVETEHAIGRNPLFFTWTEDSGTVAPSVIKIK